MAGEIALQGGVRPRPDPESEQVVAEIHQALEQADRNVGDAEKEDRVKAVVRRLAGEQREDRGAEATERESGRRRLDGGAAHGRPEREVEDGRHEDGQERGEPRGEVAREEQQEHRSPVREGVVPQQPGEAPQVTRTPHSRLHSAAGSGRRSVRSLAAGIPTRVGSARSGSGGSNVATTIPSTWSSRTSLMFRTGKPRNSPPASRAKTPTGARPMSLRRMA